jgi:hypothetical protein
MLSWTRVSQFVNCVIGRLQPLSADPCEKIAANDRLKLSADVIH